MMRIFRRRREATSTQPPVSGVLAELQSEAAIAPGLLGVPWQPSPHAADVAPVIFRGGDGEVLTCSCDQFAIKDGAGRTVRMTRGRTDPGCEVHAAPGDGLPV
jgi:hypothetical protein